MQIKTRQALEQALRADAFLLFKHSFRCSISDRAFKEYEAFRNDHAIESGWIDVVADRDLSLQVAEETGIEHKSPQALLMKKGEVAWHASHFDITCESLTGAL